MLNRIPRSRHVRFLTVCKERVASDHARTLAEVIPLPVRKTAGRSEPTPSSLNYPHPQHVLVVDDDAIHRQIVCAQLKNLGYAADESATGEDAIAAVLRGTYGLILMDLCMPGINGIETSRWIRERYNDRGNLRIIALTGNTTAEVRIKCRRAGMDGFISKPAQVDDLEAVLGINHTTSAGMP